MTLCGDDKKIYIDRLNRIEGQIRGIKKMVTEDRNCIDVLKQISAAIGALRSLGTLIIEEHMNGCIALAIRNKDHEDELIRQIVELRF